MVTGVLISWKGTTTKLWAACSRGDADAKVWEFYRNFRTWFHEAGAEIVIEFGEDKAGDFRLIEVIDAKYLPSVPPAPTPVPLPTPTE